MYSCLKCLAQPFRWISWTMCVVSSLTFKLFFKKFQIRLSFLFEVSWSDNIMYIFDYVKINSVLKIFFFCAVTFILSEPYGYSYL